MNEEEKKAIEYLKQEPDFSLSYYKREHAIDIVLNLIEKQEKVIDEMAKEINRAYYDECNFYLDFEKNIIPDGNGCISDRITKLKQFFYRKVENDE